MKIETAIQRACNPKEFLEIGFLFLEKILILFTNREFGVSLLASIPQVFFFIFTKSIYLSPIKLMT